MPEALQGLPPEEQAIYAKLLKIVKEQLEVRPEQLQAFDPSLPIVEGLQLDSLAQVTLGAAIEDEFGVVLEPEDRERIQTVQQLVTFLREKSKEGVA